MNYLFLLMGLLIGFVLGTFAQDWRWRRNANQLQRIYSNGKLYKVSCLEKK